MPGHTPYIMPDGQPLTRYLAFEEDRSKKRKGSKKKAKNPRGKDLVWNQLVAHRAKLRADGSMDSAAYAELQTVQRVGHRRRRRWMNDRLLRDMAGPMTAKEMEGHFAPPPWGDAQPVSDLAEVLSGSEVWDIFRNIDMDKESRLLKKWENHYSETSPHAKKRRGGPRAHAHEALKKWACVDKNSRLALKRANPHSVLEMEMDVLDLAEKESNEGLTVVSENSYVTSIWRGLSQFHGLPIEVEASPNPELKEVKIVIGRDDDSDDETGHRSSEGENPCEAENEDEGMVKDGLERDNVDPLEITCTDVLLAMQEYQYTGLNEELLAHFVVTQIHGLEEDSQGGGVGRDK